jgi:hypothetical protein
MELPQVYELWTYWASLHPQARMAKGIDLAAIFKAADFVEEAKEEPVMTLSELLDRFPGQHLRAEQLPYIA